MGLEECTQGAGSVCGHCSCGRIPLRGSSRLRADVPPRIALGGRPLREGAVPCAAPSLRAVWLGRRNSQRRAILLEGEGRARRQASARAPGHGTLA